MENVYQLVTDKIIEKMEQGVIPWQMPWSCTAGGAINYESRKPYSFLNQMLLQAPGEYLTFKQIQKLGGKIKKGSKSGLVVFYTMVDVKDKVTGDVKEQYPCLKWYHVFHINDTEGIPSKVEAKEQVDLQPIEYADKVANDYVEREGVTLKICRSNEAFYSPATDTVVVPEIAQYKEIEEYYSTLYHELTHSTGIEKRLAREVKTISNRSNDYSKEELVAEIGSAMSLRRLGIDSAKAFDNSVAYIKGWLKALRDDNKLIVWAAGRTEKAVKYIFNE